MSRTAIVVGILGASLMLAGCGGGDSSSPSSSVSTGAGAQTNAATQGTSQKPSAKAKTPTRTRRKTSSGGATTKTSSPTVQHRSDTGAKKGGGTKGPRKAKPGSGFNVAPSQRPAVKRKLYRDEKGACHVLGLEEVAREYKAKSLEPRDVAKAWADAWMKVGFPAYTRKPVYEGCLAGLTQGG
jgi:hypothetical protein